MVGLSFSDSSYKYCNSGVAEPFGVLHWKIIILIQIVKSPTSFIRSEKSIWWVITMYNIRIIHLRRCTITFSHLPRKTDKLKSFVLVKGHVYRWVFYLLKSMSFTERTYVLPNFFVWRFLLFATCMTVSQKKLYQQLCAVSLACSAPFKKKKKQKTSFKINISKMCS